MADPVELVIPGILPGLNDLIDAERKHRQQGAKLKRQAEMVVIAAAAHSLGRWKAKGPVYMVYRWYEPNRRRDKDNISGFGRKVIQDALVKAGRLANDGWKDIEGFEDHFAVDAEQPRIEVEIQEVDDGVQRELKPICTTKPGKWISKDPRTRRGGNGMDRLVFECVFCDVAQCFEAMDGGDRNVAE